VGERYNPRAVDDHQVLCQFPLIRHLDNGQCREVLEAGSFKTLEKGEFLFHEGDTAESLFGVVEGRIKLVRFSARGKEMLLHLVRAGQTFAEAALFGDGTYPATAVTVERCRLWCLPRARLMDLIRRDPELGVAMVGSTSMWTRTLAANLELLTQRRVEERLAVYLLGRAAGHEVEDGYEIKLAEPKNLIAAQCGTAPEVLSRTLRRLEDDGVLEGIRRGVRVVDAGKLRALAEWIGE
jgi:CRP/FNR family transcriptional regulator